MARTVHAFRLVPRRSVRIFSGQEAQALEYCRPSDSCRSVPFMRSSTIKQSDCVGNGPPTCDSRRFDSKNSLCRYHVLTNEHDVKCRHRGGFQFNKRCDARDNSHLHHTYGIYITVPGSQKRPLSRNNFHSPREHVERISNPTQKATHFGYQRSS
jgi:hypothetical protein